VSRPGWESCRFRREILDDHLPSENLRKPRSGPWPSWGVSDPSGGRGGVTVSGWLGGEVLPQPCAGPWGRGGPVYVALMTYAGILEGGVPTLGGREDGGRFIGVADPRTEGGCISPPLRQGMAILRGATAVAASPLELVGLRQED
jgi:hypothetical protein